MRIEIEKFQDHYRADCIDLPGSPPVGLGETPEMAVAALLWKVMFEETGGLTTGTWMQLLNRNDPIVINGKAWDWPDSYRGPNAP